MLGASRCRTKNVAKYQRPRWHSNISASRCPVWAFRSSLSSKSEWYACWVDDGQEETICCSIDHCFCCGTIYLYSADTGIPEKRRYYIREHQRSSGRVYVSGTAIHSRRFQSSGFGTLCSQAQQDLFPTSGYHNVRIMLRQKYRRRAHDSGTWTSNAKQAKSLISRYSSERKPDLCPRTCVKSSLRLPQKTSLIRLVEILGMNMQKRRLGVWLEP